MDIDKIIKLIQNQKPKHEKFVQKAQVARRYYRCKNDILKKQRGCDDTKPFQHANHRIPSNFFRLLVTQKVSYCFGNPVSFDIGHEETNELIMDVLGDKFPNFCRELAKYASTDSESWIHYWIDEANVFQYGRIDACNLYPVYGGYLGDDLIALLKVNYSWIDENGEQWDNYEFWDDEWCYAYRVESKGELTDLEPDYRFSLLNPETGGYDDSYVFYHGMGKVPFIKCANNADGINDLIPVKATIDSYDESRSRLADDIADSENIIFVLSGYGGQDPHEFWKKVSTDRLIKLVPDPMDKGMNPDVRTLAIEPPIDANNKNLEISRAAVFEEGMGVDPKQQIGSNVSGETLKHMNHLLIMKCAEMQNQFELSFSELVKAICQHIGYKLDIQDRVKTVWTPLMISNESEIISNIGASRDLLSEETLLKKHPWVEDVSLELERKENEAIDKTANTIGSAIDTYMSELQRQQQQEQMINAYEQSS